MDTTGPFRATKLWTAAIDIFHAEVLSSGKDQKRRRGAAWFTGSHALSVLNLGLNKNQCFGRSISRDETVGLLGKMLDLNVIQSWKPVKHFKPNSNLYKLNPNYVSSSQIARPLRSLSTNVNEVPGDGVMLDNKLKNTENKQLPSHLMTPYVNRIQDHRRGKENHVLCLSSKSVWKRIILSRLQELVNQLELGPFIPEDAIIGRWVMVNANPDFKKLRVSELPLWVLSAINSLLNYPSGVSDMNYTYPQFGIDVYKVIQDYFCNLSSPLIIQPLYNLFVNMFMYMDYVEQTEREAQRRAKVMTHLLANSESLENFVLGMVSPAKKILLMDTGAQTLNNIESNFLTENQIISTVLPPNTCFETAFTSDCPMTRIVPQCSVDTIHLISKTTHSSAPFPPYQYSDHDVENMEHKYLTKNKYEVPNKCKHYKSTCVPDSLALVPSQMNQFRSRPKSVMCDLGTNVISNVKNGRTKEDNSLQYKMKLSQSVAQNAIFQTFSSNGTDDINLNQYHDIESISTTKVEKMKTRAGFKRQAMKMKRSKSGKEVENINRSHRSLRLAHSLDDLSELRQDEELDYKAALDSVMKLMECSHRQSSPVAVNYNDEISSPTEKSSYHTAESSSSDESSLSSLPHSEQYFSPTDRTHKQDVTWGADTKKLSEMVFQLLVILLPPSNLATLNLLLQLMGHLPTIQLYSGSPLLSPPEVLAEFSDAILRQEGNMECNNRMNQRVVKFLTNHRASIFSELPSTMVSQIRLRIKELNKFKARKSYCEQVSSKEFEEQKLTGSQLALSELLSQILNDQKMPPKEKKKRLKMFKESYPHIYKHHFPSDNESNNPKPRKLLQLASLTRFKNLHL